MVHLDAIIERQGPVQCIERDPRLVDVRRFLYAAEIKKFLAADANRDGKVDRTEFEATLDF